MVSAIDPLFAGFISALALACSISLALLGYVWHRRATAGAVPLMGSLLAVTFWSAGYLIEYLSNDLNVKLFSFNISYLGAASIHVLVLLFALQFCGLGKYISRRNIILLSIIPVATILLQWTKGYHSLIYYNIALAVDGPFMLVTKQYGAWFWVDWVYNYLIIAATFTVLIYRLIRCPHLYTRQVIYIIFMMAVPIFANLNYILRFLPGPHADWTPASLCITTVFMVLLIFNRRLLDVIPVARESLIDMMSDGFIVTDTRGFVVDYNHAAQTIMPADRSITVGEMLPPIITTQLNLDFNNIIDQATEISLHTRDSLRHYIISISQLFSRRRKVVGYLLIFHDITERKQSEDLIRNLAYYDQLTSLPNRYLLHDRALMALEHASRYKEKLAILMLDLDEFKDVNDRYGHEAGDRVLQEVAVRLNKAVRKADTVSRFGGDEFVILLTELADNNVIENVCRRIIDNMEPGYELNGASLSITFSIGVSVYPGDNDSLKALIHNADLAMYQAKAQGHNKFQYYSPDMVNKHI